MVPIIAISPVICLHTIKWLHISILPMVRTLSGATALGQTRPGININEGVLHIPPNSRITEASPLDGLMSYSGYLLIGGVEPLCRDAVGVFYNSSWLDWSIYEILLLNLTLHHILPSLESNHTITIAFQLGLWELIVAEDTIKII